MLNRFYQYGVDDVKNNKSDEDSFFTRFISEEDKLDPTGCLYLLQYNYYDDISETYSRDIYSNILLTNYNKACETRHKLLQMIEFANEFVTDNCDKFDEIYDRINCDDIITDDEDNFYDEFCYYTEISKISTIEIICLNINNSDWQLDQYFNKNFNKN
jgi:predicted alpha/beta-fold hydrolase